jgi:hypothetical protein
MKKPIFLFAMAFATSFAMAQNAAIVTQTGNNHKADVTQINGSNNATVTQNGGDANRLGAVTSTDPGIYANGPKILHSGKDWYRMETAIMPPLLNPVIPMLFSNTVTILLFRYTIQFIKKEITTKLAWTSLEITMLLGRQIMNIMV